MRGFTAACVAFVVCATAVAQHPEKYHTSDHKTPGVMRALGAPVAPSDMDKALALVPPAEATCKAVANGLWSDPAVWEGGRVPVNEEFIWIPSGLSVKQNIDVRCRRLFQQGAFGPADPQTLTFQCLTDIEALLTLTNDASGLVALDQLKAAIARHQTSPTINLAVETWVTDMDSVISAGTPATPYAGQWNITFADFGPRDLTKDPWDFGRGLICCGRMHLFGRAISPYVFTDGNKVGDTIISLREPCVGWRPGDRIALPGVGLCVLDDDEGTIQSISEDGKTIVLASPLKFDHGATDAKGFPRPMFVGNISKRSINFTSENLAVDRRGHVMLMYHGDMVEMDGLPLDSRGKPTRWNQHYVSFIGLGRTDKSKDVTDPDGKGGGLANPRGRYADHLHRLGPDITGMQADFFGCFGMDSPGWIFVNHDSFASMECCFAYKFGGAGFVGEVGTETGWKRKCVAMRSTTPLNVKFVTGQIDDIDAISVLNDWGKFGQGFATMFGAIELTDNIVTGTSAPAYVLVGRSFNWNKPNPVTFATKNLPEPYTYPEPTIQSRHVPQRIERCRWFAVNVGIDPWRSSQDTKPLPLIANSYIRDCSGEASVALHLAYATNIDIEGLRAVKISNLNSKEGMNASQLGAVTTTSSPTGIHFRDSEFYGYSIGANGMTGWANSVERCHFNTGIGTYVQITSGQPVYPRTLDVTGNTYDFLPNTAAVKLKLELGADFYKQPGGFIGFTATHTHLADDRFTLDGKNVYAVEEGPNFPLNKIPGIPDFLKGLTNGQMGEKYGIWIGAKLVPVDAVQSPDVVGLVTSSEAIRLPSLTVSKSATFQTTNQTTGFMLKVKDASGQFVEAGPFDLIDKSLNVCRVQADGYNRGVFVYCDSTGPAVAPW